MLPGTLFHFFKEKKIIKFFPVQFVNTGIFLVFSILYFEKVIAVGLLFGTYILYRTGTYL